MTATDLLQTPNRFVDERGTLLHYSSLDLSTVKRMYIIEPLNTSVVRAWQGHKIEQKWFIAVKGSFKLVLIKPDNWTNPSVNLLPSEFILRHSEAQVLHVPGGHASGIVSLEPDSRLMIYSDFTTYDSKNDDFRFDKNLWYKW